MRIRACTSTSSSCLPTRPYAGFFGYRIYAPVYCQTSLPALFYGVVLFIINAVNRLNYLMQFGGAAVGYSVFSLIYWSYRLVRRQEGLGYGDVKFLAALGAWHRWESLPLLVFTAACLACCIIGIRSVTDGRKVLKNPLPFGPYLAAAGFIIGWVNLMQGD